MKKEKTLQQAFDELGDAWGKLVLIVVYHLRIDKLCRWLTKMIQRISGSGPES